MSKQFTPSTTYRFETPRMARAARKALTCAQEGKPGAFLLLGAPGVGKDLFIRDCLLLRHEKPVASLLPDNEWDMLQLLSEAAGRGYLWLQGVDCSLSSVHLERWLSSSLWESRPLGAAKPQTTAYTPLLFVSANQAKLSLGLQRRIEVIRMA